VKSGCFANNGNKPGFLPTKSNSSLLRTPSICLAFLSQCRCCPTHSDRPRNIHQQHQLPSPKPTLWFSLETPRPACLSVSPQLLCERHYCNLTTCRTRRRSIAIRARISSYVRRDCGSSVHLMGVRPHGLPRWIVRENETIATR
jgi:hypothetical protein